MVTKPGSWVMQVECYKKFVISFILKIILKINKMPKKTQFFSLNSIYSKLTLWTQTDFQFSTWLNKIFTWHIVMYEYDYPYMLYLLNCVVR